MTIQDLNQLAWPIFKAITESFPEGPRGEGILPERLTFSISVPLEDEPRFLQVIETLLRANESFGDDPPVVVLVSRWVTLSFEGYGLDQSAWELMFDLNPRVQIDDREVRRQIITLMKALADHGVV